MRSETAPHVGPVVRQGEEQAHVSEARPRERIRSDARADQASRGIPQRRGLSPHARRRKRGRCLVYQGPGRATDPVGPQRRIGGCHAMRKSGVHS